MADYTNYARFPDGSLRGWSPGMSDWQKVPVKDHNTIMAGFREMTLPGDPDAPLGESIAGLGKGYDPRTASGARRLGTQVLAPEAAPFSDIMSGAVEEGKQAVGAFKSGDLMRGAAHVGRMVPVAGPMVGTLSENIGSTIGDVEGPGSLNRRAFGNLLGVGAQALLGKAGAGIRKRFGELWEAGKPVIEPPPYDEIPFDKPAPTRAGRVLEQTVGGEEPFRKAREATFEKARSKTAAQHEAD
jgi:hypothetical protein